jgi:hypothetical protein
MFLQLLGGTVLTQSIIVRALHDSNVIDKKQVIDIANSWLVELSKLEGEEVENIKKVLDLFITYLVDEKSGHPSWLQGVLLGGKI